MLICYPLQATEENWLHETLVTLITDIHQKLDDDEAIDKSHDNWKNFLPDELDEPIKKQLERATGIRDRVFKYCEQVEVLGVADRKVISSAMESQNNIVDLLDGTGPIETIENTYPEVHAAVCDLTEFCFGKLTDFLVRERQYQRIYAALPDKLCPFCGILPLMHFSEASQDQDHYLAKSIYPFAASNMRNLSPMCERCNRVHKNDLDIIRNLAKERRKAFDPYQCEPPELSLLNSTIDEELSPPIPDWQIDFEPANEEVQTWDEVFDIRQRYKRDILGQKFNKWLSDLRTKSKMDRKNGHIQESLSKAEISNYLRQYYEYKRECLSGTEAASYLEALTFEFLLSKYDEDNPRIVTLVNDLILGIDDQQAA